MSSPGDLPNPGTEPTSPVLVGGFCTTEPSGKPFILDNWHYILCVLVTQLCPTLCDPMDGSPPGSSVHGILQARILEWATIPFSRGSS